MAKALILIVSLALFCCGTDGDDFSATVSDHGDALSTSGTDNLFTIDVGAGEILALGDVNVTYNETGGSQTLLNFELTDADADGQLGPGDTLTAIEPGPNILDETHAGMTMEVALFKDLGDNRVEFLLEDSWTAQ